MSGTYAVAFTSNHPFSAHLMVGGDVDPPTTPDPLLATPVAPDQIDLVWGASVDNVAVGGYRVFRDLVQIATTSLTTFSDTGLLPETLYVYTVDAFDVFYNYSSSSVAVSTTTLALPIPPPEEPVATTSVPRPNTGTVLITPSSFGITPFQFSVKLDWVTNIPTRYVVRWGRTGAYELGSVLGGQLQQIHSTTITELESATTYFYEVEAINSFGVRSIVSRGEFTTIGIIPPALVQNVSQLQAIVEGDSVQLRWKNPETVDFSHVRVLRNHLFYPQNPNDGALVYEGSGTSFFDSAILRDRSPQYYTIFVYDKNRRISSGAVTVAIRRVVQNIPIEDTEEPVVDEEDIQPTPSPSPTVDLFAMNVALIQGGIVSYLHDPQFFSALEPLFISIPVNAVPPHLKSIIVSMTHPSREQEVSSYLLKINPEGTAYEVLFPAPLEAGKSMLTIQLYDYELATIRTVSNSIEFQIAPRVTPVSRTVTVLTTVILIALFLMVLIIRHRLFSYRA